jgi:hypothetical protein
VVYKKYAITGVFSGIKRLKICTERGKSSTGWFFGFKLYLTINERGEITSFFLSPGNVNDRDEEMIDSLYRELWGKLFGERGYISRELFNRLYRRGIKTGKTAEKEHEEQADGYGGEDFVTETDGNRAGKQFSEEHLPDRAQTAPEFYQFYSESVRGVVNLQFLTDINHLSGESVITGFYRCLSNITIELTFLS